MYKAGYQMAPKNQWRKLNPSDLLPAAVYHFLSAYHCAVEVSGHSKPGLTEECYKIEPGSHISFLLTLTFSPPPPFIFHDLRAPHNQNENQDISKLRRRKRNPP